MKQGAISFLEKPCRPGVLAGAIREALEIACRRHTHYDQCRDSYVRLERLAAADRNVLAAIVRGMTVRQIAADSCVSERTVQFRRARLMQEMGAGSRRDLLQLVHQVGWNP